MADAGPAGHGLQERGDLAGRRVVLLGLGRFGGGLGAARWLLGQGAELTVTDKAAPETLAGPAAELAAAGARLVLGGHDDVDFAAADLLVVNPAVPLDAPPVRAALDAGVPVTSEICLLVSRWPGPVLGVTGSNGKSTVTGLCHALLATAGRAASLGGNIGGSLLDRVERAEPGEVAVLELSSFMLDLLAREGLGPEVAVITNITPNHLDRHGSMEAYAAAKRSILQRARTAVLFAEDELVREAADAFSGRALWFGGEGDVRIGEDGGLLDRRGEALLASAAIPLPGRANRLNLAAALLAVSAVLGDEVAATRALPGALASYELPPHRCQPVGTWGGVEWIDDSASTTPESTRASLAAVGAPAILIAGGRDKGLDAAPLLDEAQRVARAVVALGEQGPALARELSSRGVVTEVVPDVETAVARAAALSRPGDTVLLSPGYSSHDSHANFVERSEAYVRAVLAHAARLPLSRQREEC
jgi:UDP-N-acetylmuramoylalanine--D-glutamate ligase